MVQTTERKRPDRGTILSMRSARDYPRSTQSAASSAPGWSGTRCYGSGGI